MRERRSAFSDLIGRGIGAKPPRLDAAQGMRADAWTNVWIAFTPPGGYEPAGRLLHTAPIGAAGTTAPACASWAGETASAAPKSDGGAVGLASAAKTWLASKPPLSHSTTSWPAAILRSDTTA